MAGYSKTPTRKKLGIKEGMRVIHLHSPQNYSQLLGKLPRRTILEDRLHENASFIHYFAKNKNILSADFPKLKKALHPNGALWISWPKRASKITTNLNDNVVREIGLRGVLVDIRVVAVDEIWSGLKFVFRLKDRK
jgi:hypothetical protein